MAGMLYLAAPVRLSQPHQPGSEASELFKEMERKLMRIIINPAMIFTWIFGLWLAVTINAFDPVNGHWLHGQARAGDFYASRPRDDVALSQGLRPRRTPEIRALFQDI